MRLGGWNPPYRVWLDCGARSASSIGCTPRTGKLLGCAERTLCGCLAGGTRPTWYVSPPAPWGNSQYPRGFPAGAVFAACEARVGEIRALAQTNSNDICALRGLGKSDALRHLVPLIAAAAACRAPNRSGACLPWFVDAVEAKPKPAMLHPAKKSPACVSVAQPTDLT